MRKRKNQGGQLHNKFISAAAEMKKRTTPTFIHIITSLLYTLLQHQQFHAGILNVYIFAYLYLCYKF